MALSPQQQVRYWGIAAAVFIAFLWLMGNTLLPFIIGAAIAYLLNPLARRLVAAGVPRTAATALITAAAVLLLVLLALVVVPFLAGQVTALVDALPGLIQHLREQLDQRYPNLFAEGSAVRRGLAGMEDSLRAGGLKVLTSVLSSSLALVDFVLVVVLSPVVAFYLLMDWDRLIAAIDDLLPREHAPVVRRLARESDEVLGGFLRGQMSVCALLGVFYALALAAIGLQFGVVVGLLAGLVSFIPFVGSILGGVLSLGLALFQFWGAWGFVAAVGAVFAAGQMIEGNVLTPMILGDKIKLHPVWLIFALSAFGALLGFPGLLIAVPAAAVIGVLARFAVAQYKSGRLYAGPSAGAGGGGRDAAE
ncbi:AI-2E family transporter [Rhodobacteraceae bacterium 2CG4]|uniref:AI-2E family transporter n=1 Tax=Halovulum marinum TaxID=2662447 RepID=A0A6L5Z5J5_9RHOB|nr:AI-2E family transporter [Halovulum marinum]MSU91365.1 AI-2E family transporter [Halovulum marinum]